MDLTLNSRQKEIIQLVRKLAEKEIKPYVHQKDFSPNTDFDWHLFRMFSEHNLTCPTIPEEYGGLGLDMFSTILLMEEISCACRGLSAIINATTFAALPIILAGSKEQKERFLPRLTGKNACLAAIALTETNAGSDIKSMQTLAERHLDSYILNGQKDYILNSHEADIITLFAMTELRKKSSIRCFILQKDTTGVKIGKKHHLTVLNYARTGEIILDNVLVNKDVVLKDEEPLSGYLLLNQTLDIGRVLTAANAVGIARAAYELAHQSANERIQFGKKIIKHQAVAHTLVEMATKIEMARLMTWKAAWIIDNSDDYTIATAMAKLSASTISQEVTRMAADILAARAFEKGSLMEQLINDAHLQSTINGTNNIQRNIIASLL